MVISVGKHDTADTVSRKYKTTERSLFLLNKPVFYEGERLIVEIDEAKRYTVMPFDTLSSIAEKLNTTVEALKARNGVERVFLGQSLIIPDEA